MIGDTRLNKILVAAKILLLTLVSIFFLRVSPVVYGMAADCILAPTGENYIGVRYKAPLDNKHHIGFKHEL